MTKDWCSKKEYENALIRFLHKNPQNVYIDWLYNIDYDELRTAYRVAQKRKNQAAINTILSMTPQKLSWLQKIKRGLRRGRQKVKKWFKSNQNENEIKNYNEVYNN